MGLETVDEEASRTGYRRPKAFGEANAVTLVRRHRPVTTNETNTLTTLMTMTFGAFVPSFSRDVNQSVAVQSSKCGHANEKDPA